ncbi:molecular chaperone Hsp33 [Desulfuromusa kysingii]|uniref:33 kDa chaperonin n=1 Tax=Desulfuromusa kysingii TaxID=37625 RepID=A0A1H3VMF7_9BACT|nr:Hsp33 family molecular chaperone HslO [Desulfuromusa kysingii]SDZ75434.1 molecular chaperone Hsp33 [Desulfuromusa kysingii]
MEDYLLRVVSPDGMFRAAATVSTQLVRTVCEKQQTDYTATVALGRLLTGGALLGCLLKGEQRLALVMEGNGPLGKVSVEADARGRVRGTVRNPVAGLPPVAGRFDVAGAIGRAGFLHVWKDLGLKKPYQSMLQLQSSEVAEDLAWYLTSSEQVPSSLGLGVELDVDGRVAVAGGFLVQTLPNADSDKVDLLSERIKALPPTTTLFKQGMNPAEILGEIFSSADFSIEQQIPLQFYCPCNQQQIEKMLLGLGAEELRSLTEENDPVEVVCEYCRHHYRFNRKQMSELIEMAK